MFETQRNLSILRFYYLTLGVGGGFLLPFLALFYQQQGLSGTEIGLLSTFAGLAALIAAPIWGRLSDAAVRPRRLLQFELLASSCLMLLLSQQATFGPIAVLVVLDALLNAGSSPNSDVLALVVLSKVRSGFGSVRLFASLGWAITAFVSGWLSERFGLIVAFVGYAAGYFTGSGSVGLIRLRPRTVSTALHQQPRRNLRQSLRIVLSDRRLRKLALALGIFLFMMYGLRSFEGLYLKQLGAGEAIVGLMSTIGATIELPGMLWADRLVRRYGAVRVLRYSFLIEVVRLSGVLLVPTVPTLVVARVIGGFSFSWYVVALFTFINQAAPENQVTTTLALFNVTLASFIRMLAAPISGFIFDQVGGYWLYALGVMGSLAAWFIMRTLKAALETPHREVAH
ncbi:Putative nucleoside transporter YegT [Thermoflexales bacterium]|nr:Putative nucleoside transporter YegT [Thermoflexales bacterium]